MLRALLAEPHVMAHVPERRRWRTLPGVASADAPKKAQQPSCVCFIYALWRLALYTNTSAFSSRTATLQFLFSNLWPGAIASGRLERGARVS